MTVQTTEDLFAQGLGQAYAAHHQGAAQASRNRERAVSPALRDALGAAAAENLAWAGRLEQVFEMIGLPVAGDPDRVMQGIAEADDATDGTVARSPERDLELIRSARIAVNYLRVRYEELQAEARGLRHRRAARLLGRTLTEIGRADTASETLSANLRQTGYGLAMRLVGLAAVLGAGGFLLFRPSRSSGDGTRSRRAVPTYPFPAAGSVAGTAARD